MVHWKSFTSSWELARFDNYIIIINKEYHEVWKLEKEYRVGKETNIWSPINIDLPKNFFRTPMNRK